MNKNKNGFTLVELLVVVTVLSFSYIAFYNTIVFFNRKYKDFLLMHKFEQIERAIQKYVVINNKLPLPLKIDINDTNFNTYSSQYINENNIIIGALPIKDLDLSKDYLYDSWLSKFIYAVNVKCTESISNCLLESENNLLKVNLNKNNTSIIANSVVYVVLSNGKNRIGAYNINGTVNKINNTVKNTYGYIINTNSNVFEYRTNDDSLIFKSKILINVY